MMIMITLTEQDILQACRSYLQTRGFCVTTGRLEKEVIPDVPDNADFVLNVSYVAEVKKADA